jgi:hypothetical protein
MTQDSLGLDVDFQSLDEEGAAEVLLCVLYALAALAERGLVHKDVRWGNVLECRQQVQAKPARWQRYYKLIDLELVTQQGQVRTS